MRYHKLMRKKEIYDFDITKTHHHYESPVNWRKHKHTDVQYSEMDTDTYTQYSTVQHLGQSGQ